LPDLARLFVPFPPALVPAFVRFRGASSDMTTRFPTGVREQRRENSVDRPPPAELVSTGERPDRSPPSQKRPDQNRPGQQSVPLANCEACVFRTDAKIFRIERSGWR
jgi:hypothetical protein